MFNAGFEKVAKEKEDHTMSRALLGNPVSAAVHARKGEKLKAGGHALKHLAGQSLKGLGIGAGAGSLVGAGVGALKGGKEGAKRGALIGGGLTGYLGGAAGALKGHLGSEATKIHKKYQKD
jgi:hypothetical protein